MTRSVRSGRGQRVNVVTAIPCVAKYVVPNVLPPCSLLPEARRVTGEDAGHTKGEGYQSVEAVTRASVSVTPREQDRPGGGGAVDRAVVAGGGQDERKMASPRVFLTGAPS